MIILQGVTYATRARDKGKKVLAAAEVAIPCDHRIAVLGCAANEPKIFIEVLGGLRVPQAGRVTRNARVSFPAGYVGGFKPEISVRLNAAYVARLYGADVEAVINFVEQIMNLGESFDKPIGRLAPAQRRRFSEVLAFSIPFDVYLFEDELVRDNGRFYNEYARSLFEARIKSAGMIVASNDRDFVREFCDMALVLHRGKVRLFQNVERAISFFER